MARVPLKIIFAVMWIFTITLAILALYHPDDRMANLLSDAFGSTLGIVLLTTVGGVILRFKGMI